MRPSRSDIALVVGPIQAQRLPWRQFDRSASSTRVTTKEAIACVGPGRSRETRSRASVRGIGQRPRSAEPLVSEASSVAHDKVDAHEPDRADRASLRDDSSSRAMNTSRPERSPSADAVAAAIGHPTPTQSYTSSQPHDSNTRLANPTTAEHAPHTKSARRLQKFAICGHASPGPAASKQTVCRQMSSRRPKMPEDVRARPRIRTPRQKREKPPRPAARPRLAGHSAGTSSSSGCRRGPSTPGLGGCPPWRSSACRTCGAGRGTARRADRAARNAAL